MSQQLYARRLALDKAQGNLIAITTHFPASENQEDLEAGHIDLELTDGANFWVAQGIQAETLQTKQQRPQRLTRVLQALTGECFGSAESDLPRFFYTLDYKTARFAINGREGILVERILEIDLRPSPRPQQAILTSLARLMQNLKVLQHSIGQLERGRQELEVLDSNFGEISMQYRAKDTSFLEAATDLLNTKKAELRRAHGLGQENMNDGATTESEEDEDSAGELSPLRYSDEEF